MYITVRLFTFEKDVYKINMHILMNIKIVKVKVVGPYNHERHGKQGNILCKRERKSWLFSMKNSLL